MRTILFPLRLFPVLLALAALLAWPGRAAAQQFAVEPPSAPAGATVRVFGFGFAGSACGVNLVWGSLEDAIHASQPVAPVVMDIDLRQLPRVREWMPGDPIEERPQDSFLPLEPAGAHLGRAEVDANGGFSLEVVVPLGAKPGQHLLWAQGLAPDGDSCKLSGEEAAAAVQVESQPEGQAVPAPAAGDEGEKEAGAARHGRVGPLREGGAAGALEGAGGSAPAPPILSFDGINSSGSPVPDTIGDVGRSHYVQMVNASFAVYDKLGNLLAGPSAINSLWAGQMNLCAANNRGDPVVLYDPLADRWLLSQFAFNVDAAGNTLPPYFMAIAVSRGSNPVTSGWNLYCFQTPNLPDYPKFGVAAEAYFMSTYEGSVLGIYAFDRARMLAAMPATMLRATMPSRAIGRPQTRILPADIDGSAGEGRGWFVRSIDGEMQGGGADRLEMWLFVPSFSLPAAAYLTLMNVEITSPYDIRMCGASLPRACIPQPGTAATLDPLSNRLMWRLQYRNFATYETLVACQTVDAGDFDDHAAIRWYELRRPVEDALPFFRRRWRIHQQGTFAPDAAHRWMGSAAMDRSGNIAIGYTAVSATVFPSIRYTGRARGDALGTLAGSESTLMAGTGAQNFACGALPLCPRWGDYSSLNVDPLDDCTFWYTSQYYQATGGLWRTRIGSFRFLDCSPSIAQLCRFFPQACFGVPPAGLSLGTVRLRFSDESEVLVAPLGELCGIVFPCPSCPEPCGRSHRFVFDFAAANLVPEVLSVRLFDSQGQEAAREETIAGVKVLRFSPRGFPAANAGEDHFFAFELAPAGEPGVEYEVAVSLEVEGSEPPGGGLGGDCNADRRLDISDAVCLFGVLFTGVPPALPCGDGSPQDAANVMLADWQGDSTVNIADGIALLQFVFLDGPKHVLGGGCLELRGCGELCPP